MVVAAQHYLEAPLLNTNDRSIGHLPHWGRNKKRGCISRGRKAGCMVFLGKH